MTKIKICGITTPDDARLCAELGADAIGINLVPGTPRYVTLDAARAIVRALGESAPHVLTVGVLANMPLSDMLALRSEFGCLQLHGNEPPYQLIPLLPHAYKAVRIGNEEDVAAASEYPGEYLLVDAKVPGVLGGSGRVFDWSLVQKLARARKLTLAGGLGPANVRDAIRAVRPYAIDVASGVELEGNPRKKDSARIRDFVREARAADE
ncbi:N-(5'-phosphoribosyl)anthranilate isomerase [Pendulispora albinea]|uniref:N-(5'-phosphoribosyl)anthranilate isomerase n=1 Tax=Pendulispora albinea TaxID=2741071 RepID=A0ABZ2MBM6_9BACT